MLCTCKQCGRRYEYGNGYNSNFCSSNCSTEYERKIRMEEESAEAAERQAEAAERQAEEAERQADAAERQAKAAERQAMEAKKASEVAEKEAKAGELARKVQSLRDAATDGSAKAMWELARRYETGNGAYQDTELANKWYKKAAEAGLSWAQLLLKANNGDADAAYKLAKLSDNHELPDDDEAFKFSFKLYLAAAEQGHVEAQKEVAKCYEHGWGVDKNIGEAIKWFLPFANDLKPSTWNKFGYAYKSGEGIEKNYSEALKWYQKSLEKEDPYAEFEVADMYSKGYGTEKDSKKSLDLLLKAAKHCEENEKLQKNNDLKDLYAKICYALGQDYESSNRLQAEQWYKKSFDANGNGKTKIKYAEICYALGQDYERSDHLLAKQWYKKSFDTNGNEKAEKKYKMFRHMILEHKKWEERYRRDEEEAKARKELILTILAWIFIWIPLSLLFGYGIYKLFSKITVLFL